MRSLQGKRALVTGAAGGIGRAVALRLAAAGADVALVDLAAEKLAQTAAELEQFGGRVLPLVCDVRQVEQISSVVQQVLTAWHGVDILINNVGVVHYGPTEAMSAKDWQKLLEINLHAPIHFTRLLLPTLLDQPEASIVNVASMYGFFATRKTAAYHATKFGLVGFSEALRAEYGRLGMGVTTVCPGFVSTNLFEHGSTSEAGKEVPTPPWYLRTTPEKIAAKIVSAIYWKKRLVLATPLAYAMYYLKNWAPWLLDWAQHWGRRRAMQKRAAAKGKKE